MSCNYIEIPCIDKLDENDKKCFIKMVEAYSPKLSKRLDVNHSAFTLHDFEHHCVDIYKIISECILDEEIAYDVKFGLNTRELYVLDLAVLFHDIGMNVLGANRKRHSFDSAEFIDEEYNKPSSELSKEGSLSANEIKALKAIVKAHSDIKDNSVPKDQRGLGADDLKNYRAKTGVRSDIRTLFLAGVLRLADELDVTSDRLGNREIEAELEEIDKKLKKAEEGGKKEDVEMYKEYKNSLKHWKKLHLFSHLEKDENNDIILNVDDDEVEKMLANGQTKDAIAEDIVDVLRDTTLKLFEVKQIAFSGKGISRIAQINGIKPVTENEELDKSIKKKIAYKELRSVEDDNSEDNKVSSDVRATNSNVGNNQGSVALGEAYLDEEKTPIDPELAEIITEEVRKRRLIKFGHFRLNNESCARDWIDTREIAETKVLLSKIVNTIVKDINGCFKKRPMIAGIDFVGTLFASRIAFALQVPLTYVISEKNIENSSKFEIEPVPLERDSNIIFITDVVVTYDTIKKVINKYSLKEDRVYIYSVFYRGDRNISQTDKILYEHTKYVNSSFKAELFKKEDCVYNSSGCLATNQTINCMEK